MPPLPAPRNANPCYSFEAGKCLRGRACRFSHLPATVPPGAGTETAGDAFDPAAGSSNSNDAGGENLFNDKGGASGESGWVLRGRVKQNLEKSEKLRERSTMSHPSGDFGSGSGGVSSLALRSTGGHTSLTHSLTH